MRVNPAELAEWTRANRKAASAYYAEPIATQRLCVECLSECGTNAACYRCRETLRLRAFREANR